MSEPQETGFVLARHIVTAMNKATEGNATWDHRGQFLVAAGPEHRVNGYMKILQETATQAGLPAEKITRRPWRRDAVPTSEVSEQCGMEACDLNLPFHFAVHGDFVAAIAERNFEFRQGRTNFAANIAALFATKIPA